MTRRIDEQSDATAAGRRPRRAGWKSLSRQIVTLTVVWLVLVGQLSLVTVVGGLLVATLVTLLFPLPPVDYRGRLRPVGLIRMLARLLADLAVSSARLAAWSFRRDPAPTAGIVRVHLRSQSDLYEVNVAELASVVPGTLVVDARRRTRTLYLHVFDLSGPDDRDAVVTDTLALERRVVEALGSNAELRALAEVERAANEQEGRAAP